MIPDRLFTAHLKVFNMANLFDRPMVDAPEKMDPGMEDLVDSRKEPSVDHCDAQWSPAFAGMTGYFFRALGLGGRKAGQGCPVPAVILIPQFSFLV